MINKVLVGTANKAKQQEFGRILSFIPRDFKIYFPQDLGIIEKPDETGSTFSENSLLKAKFYFEKSGISTITDDGGLEIPILNNEPGVHSRRWLGYEATDEEILQYALKRLKKYKTKDDRRAVLKTCLTYFDGKNIIQESGVIEGYLSERSKNSYTKGYPFRSIFIVSEVEKYYDELSKKEHDSFNHREMAFKKLWKRIKLLYNK